MGHICVAGGSIKILDAAHAAQGTGAFHPGAKSLLHGLSPSVQATALLPLLWLPGFLCNPLSGDRHPEVSGGLELTSLIFFKCVS